MQSMTGYGSGRASLGDGEVVLDLRAVNHRFLDVRVRLPSRIQSQAPAVERVIRARLGRGRVDAMARFEGPTLPQTNLDLTRARSAFRELGALRDALSPDEPVPLSLLSCVPDLFVSTRVVDQDALENALRGAAEDACDAVQAMRGREGAALRAELTRRVEEVDEHLGALRAELPALVELRRARLRDRIEALLEDVEAELQPSRLEQEVAILADRSDVTEELVRLESHLEQMRGMIENSQEPVGKRMDFLLQEIAREVNTVGSKVQDTAVTATVVDLKATVEQMREQAQNVL